MSTASVPGATQAIICNSILFGGKKMSKENIELQGFTQLQSLILERQKFEAEPEHQVPPFDNTGNKSRRCRSER